MTRYGHIGWRVIAVVAFAGTAALAVTLTHVPAHPAEATLSSNLTQVPCATSELKACVGLGTTVRMAHAREIACLGMELNTGRLARTIGWLAAQGLEVDRS